MRSVCACVCGGMGGGGGARSGTELNCEMQSFAQLSACGSSFTAGRYFFFVIVFTISSKEQPGGTAQPRQNLSIFKTSLPATN